MSFSAFCSRMGVSLIHPFPAVSERGVGPTVKGKVKAGKRNWPSRGIRQ